MEKLGLQDMDVAGKRVLVRVDFNVPLEKGNIADDTRIRESLPTLQYILEKGGSIILMSHLGRPKGKPDAGLSLRIVGARLEELLGKHVEFASDCVGAEAQEKARSLKKGEVLLLENVRFHAAEEKPSEDPSFAKKLAGLGDLYVNDAFGTAHREHASTATIAKYFPDKAVAGFLMQKEITFLSTLIHQPKHPFYAIIGGAKISSKIGVLESLLSKVDALFIGGGMAYTFLKAQGLEIGNSLFEEKSLPEAKRFLDDSSHKRVKVYFPTDVIVASDFKEEAPCKTIKVNEGIPQGWQGMDIGPETLKAWESILKDGATLFWNGPLGVFEFPRFAGGTNAIARTLASLKATTVVGGGDSVSAINKLGISNKFSHISTGGGASLEFLEFGELPGINTLTNK